MPNRRSGKQKNTKKRKAQAKPVRSAKQAAKVNVSVNPLAELEAGPSTKLPSVWLLTKNSWAILWRNRRVVSYILLIYTVAYIIFVLGISSPANVSALKHDFNGVFHGNFKTLDTSYNVFTNLLSATTGSSSPEGSAFQIFIVIITSLAIIWSLRQFYLGLKIRARDGYYQGMYPLVKFILVLLFVAFQLIPLLIGSGLFNLLITDGIAVNAFEKVIAIIISAGLVLVSLYLMASSIVAVYIVCLPDVTPMRAIRSAKALVKDRRWLVIRKLIYLPVLLLAVLAVISFPLIILIPAIAAWVFLLLTIMALAYINSYLYSLYRGLINDQS